MGRCTRFPQVMERINLTKEPIRCPVSGTLAAAEWAPYAPARLTMVYVVDIEEAAEGRDCVLPKAGRT
jgi:hypothetical protein